MTTETLLAVRGLEKHFPVRSGVLRRVIGHVRAVDGISFHIDAGEMTDVRWFSRDEVMAALAGEHPDLHVPAPIAIAHHLIKAWAEGEICMD